MLEGPILPTLLRLSAPNVLNLLAIAGMITFDGLFMGRLGADALAGVSLAFPFVMLMQHTAASGMGGGVSSAIARALGAGKRDVANALVLHTLVLGARPGGGVLHGIAARCAYCLPLDGRSRRHAHRRNELRQRGIQRRHLDLHAEPAWERRARHRQHGAAGRRHRRQRARAHPDFAGADLRLGAVPGARARRRGMGPDGVVRRRQPRTARLPSLAPVARSH